MTSRERVIKTLEFDSPDRLPRHLWHLPGIGMTRKSELDAVRARFPEDIVQPSDPRGPSLRSKGSVASVGTYTDEWGSEWTVAEVGVCGEVKNPPLTDYAALEGWTPPWELLDHADFSQVDAFRDATDCFVMSGPPVRLFERMQFLRGTENIFMDLAFQPDEFFRLRDQIHAYNLRELEMWCKTKVDAIFLMDDWGSQQSLLIAPDQWREQFKPFYKEYTDMIKQAGKYVFMHSDGHTRAIYPDLIEIGVDALNSQLFCMDIEELSAAFRGKITFYGEVDRQQILPFGTPEDVKAAVRRLRAALDDGRGGLIAQLEWGMSDPKENIEAAFEAFAE